MNVRVPMMTRDPNGMLRDAATVMPCLGATPDAVMPCDAFAPQQVRQAQYAVRVAAKIFVMVT
jgi:hypothetical protein